MNDEQKSSTFKKSSEFIPVKDIYHDAVRHALLKDNWQITKDPFILRWGARDLYIDLGAEKLIAAHR